MQPTTEAPAAAPQPTETAPAVRAPAPSPDPIPAKQPSPRITLDMLKALPDTERRDMYIRNLVDAELAREAFDLDQRLARVFAMSGKFDDINGQTLEQSIATAMAKIQIGRSWGFNPADSIRYIYFTNGKPAIENDIVAAKLQQAGYGWDVEWQFEEVTHKGKPWKRCTGCTLWLKKLDPATNVYKPVVDRTGNPVSEAFTEGDADHAMIWEKGKQIPLSEKWNFKSWPRDMYYWRAIGRVRKYHVPHVLRGGILREERLDVITADAPPEMLPPDVQGQLPEAQAPESSAAPRPTLTERILAQAKEGEGGGQGTLLDSAE